MESARGATGSPQSLLPTTLVLSLPTVSAVLLDVCRQIALLALRLLLWTLLALARSGKDPLARAAAAAAAAAAPVSSASSSAAESTDDVEPTCWMAKSIGSRSPKPASMPTTLLPVRHVDDAVPQIREIQQERPHDEARQPGHDVPPHGAANAGQQAFLVLASGSADFGFLAYGSPVFGFLFLACGSLLMSSVLIGSPSSSSSSSRGSPLPPRPPPRQHIHTQRHRQPQHGHPNHQVLQRLQRLPVHQPAPLVARIEHGRKVVVGVGDAALVRVVELAAGVEKDDGRGQGPQDDEDGTAQPRAAAFAAWVVVVVAVVVVVVTGPLVFLRKESVEHNGREHGIEAHQEPQRRVVQGVSAGNVLGIDRVPAQLVGVEGFHDEGGDEDGDGEHGGGHEKAVQTAAEGVEAPVAGAGQSSPFSPSSLSSWILRYLALLDGEGACTASSSSLSLLPHKALDPPRGKHQQVQRRERRLNVVRNHDADARQVRVAGEGNRLAKLALAFVGRRPNHIVDKVRVDAPPPAGGVVGVEQVAREPLRDDAKVRRARRRVDRLRQIAAVAARGRVEDPVRRQGVADEQNGERDAAAQRLGRVPRVGRDERGEPLAVDGAVAGKVELGPVGDGSGAGVGRAGVGHGRH
ncbi:hypothetical protein SPBR_02491 [Sporothrix brasiliensis 5110]|uniref:Uncharacterized protein n=1 Tax=Sporothrix brasiliensis 5110 TaxID=1398154 RepID=A0A0C2F2P6_9PEZI|nr:uncharacterized protein SPBR_02491 [Sporothrix brasiliensis 5110]KIH93139.1 hypothetical protein SPBR_02491 [Sporothrix brasiliensis 5110]